jgi:hypothetical protein
MRRFITVIGLVSAVLSGGVARAQEVAQPEAASREGDLLWQVNAGAGLWEFTVGNTKYRALVGQAGLYLGHSFDAPEDRYTPGIYWSLGYQLRLSADDTAVIHRHQLAATMRNGNVLATLGIGPTQLLGFPGGISASHGGSLSAVFTYHIGNTPFAFTLPISLDVLAVGGGVRTFFESGVAIGFTNF